MRNLRSNPTQRRDHYQELTGIVGPLRLIPIEPTCPWVELCGKVGDGVNQAADLISATAFDSVFEFYTVDDFRQLV